MDTILIYGSVAFVLMVNTGKNGLDCIESRRTTIQNKRLGYHLVAHEQLGKYNFFAVHICHSKLFMKYLLTPLSHTDLLITNAKSTLQSFTEAEKLCITHFLNI